MKITLRSAAEADQEQCMILWNLMVAAELRLQMRLGGVAPEEIWKQVQSTTFRLAYLLDDAEIKINGKTYYPRIAFAAEDGSLLPGAAGFGYAHEYAVFPEEALEDAEGFKLEP